VLSRRLLCALPAVLLLAACGGDDEPKASAETTATPTPAADAPGGRFPEKPQVDLDFTTGEQGLPPVERAAGTAALAGDSYLVRLARAGSLRVPAERAAEPGTAGISVVGRSAGRSACGGAPACSAAARRTGAAATS